MVLTGFALLSNKFFNCELILKYCSEGTMHGDTKYFRGAQYKKMHAISVQEILKVFPGIKPTSPQ